MIKLILNCVITSFSLISKSEMLEVEKNAFQLNEKDYSLKAARKNLEKHKIVALSRDGDTNYIKLKGENEFYVFWEETKYYKNSRMGFLFPSKDIYK